MDFNDFTAKCPCCIISENFLIKQLYMFMVKDFGSEDQLNKQVLPVINP